MSSEKTRLREREAGVLTVTVRLSRSAAGTRAVTVTSETTGASGPSKVNLLYAGEFQDSDDESVTFTHNHCWWLGAAV